MVVPDGFSLQHCGIAGTRAPTVMYQQLHGRLFGKVGSPLSRAVRVLSFESSAKNGPRAKRRHPVPAISMRQAKVHMEGSNVFIGPKKPYVPQCW